MAVKKIKAQKDSTVKLDKKSKMKTKSSSKKLPNTLIQKKSSPTKSNKKVKTLTKLTGKAGLTPATIEKMLNKIIVDKKKVSTKKTQKTQSKNKNIIVVPKKNKGKKTAKIDPKSKDLLSVYKKLVLARLIDEKIIILYKQNKCHFQIGCAGHEIVGLAASEVFTANKDWFYPYYRDLSLCLAVGMTAEEVFLNALNKDADPNSHGRQMPAHFGHKNLRIVSQSSPTGTQFLQAVGMAVGIQKESVKKDLPKTKTSEVVYVSAGEGTCAQGDFHEALNWAARDLLPIIFVIQNNGYAISVPVSEQLAGGSVYKLTEGYEGLERFKVNGSDYLETLSAFQQAYDRAENGLGPSLIEAFVPRLQSHSISDNHLKYRAATEIESDKRTCPIEVLRQVIIKNKIAKVAELDQIVQEIKKQVDISAELAEKQDDPKPTAVSDYIYADSPEKDYPEPLATGEDIYMVDALNHALDEELSHNPNMYIFGQDVAHGKGGVFSVTTGLTAKHGNDRVFNSQLAESSIAGVAIGMASKGLKPVVEIQFGDYIWTAMNQIRNEMSMFHYRSGGDFSCALVMRVAVGGYIRGGCYHSQNIEATFSHFPGLHILYPSNALDAKGLLKTAIRSNNPVLFLEHKGLYRQVYAKGAELSQDQLIPIGRAKIITSGTSLSIITWGALVQKSLLCAKELEREGHSIEVIDLRSIVPYDQETVFESVKKTGKVLIVHEDVEFMGFGAEISAQIADLCFEFLDAPIRRIAMKNTPAVPHSPILEDAVLPQVWDILSKARELLAY